MAKREKYHWLIERIREHGDRSAFVIQSINYSYSALYDAVEQNLAFIRQKDIRAGEVVAILSDYSFSSVAIFLALFENGNIIVPITSTVDQEIEERLSEGSVDCVIEIVGEALHARKLDAPAVKHDFVQRLRSTGASGLMLFSSGSTGEPKAMIHDLGPFLEIFRDRRPRPLVMMLFLMFDHIGGLNTLFTGLSSGATLVLTQSRNPQEIAQLIETQRVRVLPTSPTFLNIMLMSGVHTSHDLSSIRIISYGTEPMPENLLVRLKELFPRVKFIQTFGTSETGITQTMSKSSSSTFFKITDDNIQHKIVNRELWLKSSTQIIGYLNYPMDNFTEDGWYKTGDLVEQTDDGYIRVVGRLKEIINVGGQKVFPSEVENVLFELPGIIDCTVFGLASVITGQMVVADVVVTGDLDKKNIRRFCRERLDSYKIPAKINIVEATGFSDRFKKTRLR